MPEKISILKDSGETISSNIVSIFMIPDTEKKYIITTENSVDPHGLTVLHVSEIIDGSLQKIATDEEWSSIKTIMRAIISGNVGSYQYLPAVESIKAASQYSRDISVSAAASKQMIDNYTVAEKSNVALNAPAAVQPAAPAPANPAIFPTNGGTVANAEDELIPGISEVDATPVPPSVLQGIPDATAQAVQTVQPVMPDATAQVVSPVMPDASVQPVPPVMPPVGGVPTLVIDNNVDAPMDPTLQKGMVQQLPGAQAVNAVTPDMVTNPALFGDAVMTPQVMPPVDPTMMQTSVMPTNDVASVPPVVDNGLSNEVQVPNIIAPTTPVVENVPPMVPTMDVSNIQVNNDVIAPMPVVVTENAEVPTQPAVQVLQPSVTVPTAQIAQEAQASVAVPEVKIDTNAAPSFAPNASLDEVVMAAQEMFMEGVKNLVQTIQEKVYREIYTKEAELKEREASVETREKFVNEQMMVMMSNFAAMQGKTMPPIPATAQPAVNETKDDNK